MDRWYLIGYVLWDVQYLHHRAVLLTISLPVQKRLFWNVKSAFLLTITVQGRYVQNNIVFVFNMCLCNTCRIFDNGCIIEWAMFKSLKLDGSRNHMTKIYKFDDIFIYQEISTYIILYQPFSNKCRPKIVICISINYQIYQLSCGGVIST